MNSARPLVILWPYKRGREAYPSPITFETADRNK
jgi:hypothetical protein